MANDNKKVKSTDFSNAVVYSKSAYSPHDWLPNVKSSPNIDNATIVILPGGGDWNTWLYNQPPSTYTCHHQRQVDIAQLELLMEAVAKKKYIIGICRGAQCLGITMGGELFQHVSNHTGNGHNIITSDGLTLYTNTIHHQMVNWHSIPNVETRGKLFAWADSLSKTYITKHGEEALAPDNQGLLVNTDYKEPEIFYFRALNAFGVQGHPEWSMPHSALQYIRSKIAVTYNFAISKSEPVIDETILARFRWFTAVYPELMPTFEKYFKKPKMLVLPTIPQKSLIITNIPSTNLSLTDNNNTTTVNNDNSNNNNNDHDTKKKNRNRSVEVTGHWGN